jgi:hypothetical protein
VIVRRKTELKIFSGALVLLAAAALLGAAAARSVLQGTAVSDPVGDTVEISGPGSTAAYHDIVEVTITRTAEALDFSMDLAAPVPDRPPLLPQVKQLWWQWSIDSDPATFPAGFPRAPGLAFPPEFAVVVAWDGVQFTAYVIDRRPLLTGGEPVITPIGFSLNGTKVLAFVDTAVLGDPASFVFTGQTKAFKASPGTEGFLFTDYVPKIGTWVPWPS